MDIENLKDQHVQILRAIAVLRDHAKAGIRNHAESIAREVVSLSSLLKLHLAVEDRFLYPALRSDTHPDLAAMGHSYQQEMKGIAAAFAGFSRRWNTAARVAADPEGFRADANTVLKRVHLRMQKENTQFYPAIEAI